MRLRLRTWPEVRSLLVVGAASFMRRMHFMAFYLRAGFRVYGLRAQLQKP